jgi:translation elongation factor P/translation initiation factor 5A
MVQLLKDTAIVDLKKYIELVEIKRAVESKKKVLITNHYDKGQMYLFMDKDEIEPILIKENEKFESRAIRAEQALTQANNQLIDIVLKVHKLKEMSVCKFLKWKKEQSK